MIQLLLPAGALFVAVLVLSGVAGAFARRRLAQARAIRVPSELSGAQIATRMLDKGKASKVLVIEFDGHLSDRYDPANRRLLLSRRNYRGRSAAAWAVALHEAGHALQHREGLASYRARVTAIRSCRYLAGGAALLCAITGISRAIPFRIGGLIVAVIWSACFIANLVTLAAEFDASRRAVKLLQETGSARFRIEEIESAMTGVAWRDLDALLSTFPALTYSLLPFSRKRPGRPKPDQGPDTT